MAENHWHECELHKEGHPTIFNLKYRNVTVVNEELKIRKCEIGCSEGRYRSEKVIMFVGETGTGKTTTINTVVNYLLGVQWDDDERYQLVVDEEEAKERSQTVSQTKWISSYTFHQTKTSNCRITLVDTPGYGHTGGRESDDFTTSQVREFFSKIGERGIDHIDAVAFFVKESSLRLSDSQRYIFSSVFPLFGDDIGDNVFVFKTHVELQNIDDEAPSMEAIKMTNIHPKGYFLCNNIVLFAQKKTKRNSKVTALDTVYKEVWNKIQTNLGNFFAELDKCQSRSIVLSRDVLNERKNLEIIVEGLHDLIRRRLVELAKLQAEADIFKKYAAQINRNQRFSYEVVEEKIEEIILEGGKQATVCTNCQMTCHFPCNEDIFMKVAGVRMCRIMKFSRCMLCNCMSGDHETGVKKYELNRVTVTKTDQHMLKIHTAAKEKSNEKDEVLRNIVKKQKQLHQQLEAYMEKLQKCLKRLSEISLMPNPFLLLQELKHLQEREMSEGTLQWEDRVKELRRLYERGKKIVRSQLDQIE